MKGIGIVEAVVIDETEHMRCEFEHMRCELDFIEGEIRDI